MSRARNIKPGFFRNDQLAECDPLARILFAALWCEADREGRLEDRPRRLKAACLPYDDCDVNELLDQLAGQSLIVRYQVDGGSYIAIPRFCEHQNPHHMEAPSQIPPQPGSGNRYNHKPISPKQRARIYARDGGKCVLCGSAESLQIDHIVMVAHGGSSDDDNLRTLCAQCNNKRSKGRANPDQSQTNPADSPSLIPLSPSQSESTDVDSSPEPAAPDSDDDDAPGAPRCPVKRIVALYHATLPELPPVNEIPDQTVRMIRQRWRSLPERQTLDWWKGFFTYVRKCPFLMGEKTSFTADLLWLVRPTNFAKVLNGNYENREAA